MKKHFDKLNWLTEKGIGKAFGVRIFGWHITLHMAFIKKGFWRKNLSNNLS